MSVSSIRYSSIGIIPDFGAKIKWIFDEKKLGTKTGRAVRGVGGGGQQIVCSV